MITFNLSNVALGDFFLELNFKGLYCKFKKRTTKLLPCVHVFNKMWNKEKVQKRVMHVKNFVLLIFEVLVAVAIAVTTIHWGWPWFLPYFLAPLKKQHHNTTTEQQNFGTPAPQPSEEEYFYPKMKKKYFLWFIYIYSTTQIHVNVFQDSCLQSVIHLIINHLFGAYYGK